MTEQQLLALLVIVLCIFVLIFYVKVSPCPFNELYSDTIERREFLVKADDIQDAIERYNGQLPKLNDSHPCDKVYRVIRLSSSYEYNGWYRVTAEYENADIIDSILRELKG